MSEFHCIPGRSGWVTCWLIDGVPHQTLAVYIRIVKGTEIRIRVAETAVHVSALVHLDERDPEHRYILPLGRVK